MGKCRYPATLKHNFEQKSFESTISIEEGGRKRKKEGGGPAKLSRLRSGPGVDDSHHVPQESQKTAAAFRNSTRAPLLPPPSPSSPFLPFRGKPSLPPTTLIPRPGRSSLLLLLPPSPSPLLSPPIKNVSISETVAPQRGSKERDCFAVDRMAWNAVKGVVKNNA